MRSWQCITCTTQHTPHLPESQPWLDVNLEAGVESPLLLFQLLPALQIHWAAHTALQHTHTHHICPSPDRTIVQVQSQHSALVVALAIPVVAVCCLCCVVGCQRAQPLQTDFQHIWNLHTRRAPQCSAITITTLSVLSALRGADRMKRRVS